MSAQKDGDLVAHATGLFCEGCGKPVRRGQFVNAYDDVGEVHVDCANPWATPKPDDLPIYVLLGDPLVRFRVKHDGLAEAVQAPRADPYAHRDGSRECRPVDDIEGAAI